jgi:hypothetical protein
MNILIRNARAGYINMSNLHHAYAQNVNTAIKWAWYKDLIYLLIMGGNHVQYSDDYCCW